MTPDRITQIIQVSESRTFDTERECAYLLATLVLFVPKMEESVLGGVGMMVDVCGCGNKAVVVRCLDGIIKATQASAAFREAIAATDMADKLGELVEDSAVEVAEAAAELQSITVM
jgi:hypothetical protein